MVDERVGGICPFILYARSYVVLRWLDTIYTGQTRGVYQVITLYVKSIQTVIKKKWREVLEKKAKEKRGSGILFTVVQSDIPLHLKC